MKIRSYSELVALETFEDRFDYLKIVGGAERYAFGPERYLNQDFYRSQEWKDIRREVILRDEWDLGIDGYGIGKYPFIHHMNPITVQDIVDRSKFLMDPEYLILCSKDTHEAIHKGNLTTHDMRLLRFAERTPGDTTPWRRING